MAENILLFPTQITHHQREVDDVEKDKWFDLFLKHSNEKGESHDWLGFEEIHKEDSVKFFFRDVLTPAVAEYFKGLHIRFSDFDTYITKSFFNVTNEAGITRHDHIENHLSFVYYPHVAEGKHRHLKLWTSNRKHPNEPYPKWFANVVDEWDTTNSLVMNMPAEEGTLYIFPSDMEHCIEVLDGDEPSGIQGFKSKQDLVKTRFCVAGDMIFIRNHTREYQRMLPPVHSWKKL